MADRLLQQALLPDDPWQKDRLCPACQEFKDAFQQALKEKGPVWIACNIAKEERVLPMIPNGGTIDDMIIK